MKLQNLLEMISQIAIQNISLVDQEEKRLKEKREAATGRSKSS